MYIVFIYLHTNFIYNIYKEIRVKYSNCTLNFTYFCIIYIMYITLGAVPLRNSDYEFLFRKRKGDTDILF